MCFHDDLNTVCCCRQDIAAQKRKLYYRKAEVIPFVVKFSSELLFLIQRYKFKYEEEVFVSDLLLLLLLLFCLFVFCCCFFVVVWFCLVLFCFVFFVVVVVFCCCCFSFAFCFFYNF